MKNYIIMAVTGGLLINALSVSEHNKKHDLFYKADLKSLDKKCAFNPPANNKTAKYLCKIA